MDTERHKVVLRRSQHFRHCAKTAAGAGHTRSRIQVDVVTTFAMASRMRGVRLIEEFIRQKPDRMIYHYTSAAGLIGILKTKSIWATSHLHLNDRLEFETAAKLFGQELKQSALTEPHQRLLMRLVAERRDPRFVTSFSEHHDRLSQWRAYGVGEGYALGFSDTNPIFASAEAASFGLIKCEYRRPKQRELCRVLIAEFRDLMTSGRSIDSPVVEQQIRTSFERYRWTYALALLRASFKHNGFSEEGEWRLVSQYPNDLVPKLAYRSGRFGVVPYYSLPLSPPSVESRIDRLIIGPTANRRAAKASLKQALATTGFGGTEVVVSHTPLRH
jgi:hypothetical protein